MPQPLSALPDAELDRRLATELIAGKAADTRAFASPDRQSQYATVIFVGSRPCGWTVGGRVWGADHENRAKTIAAEFNNA